MLARNRSTEHSIIGRETWLTVTESVAVLVIIITALIGNLTLCFAVYRFRALRRIQNYYIVSLAILDLLVTSLCISTALVVAILGRWPFGVLVCQIQGSLLYFLGSSLLLNLTLIALNRYFKMVRPVTIYQMIYTKRNVLLSIAASGIFSGVFTISFLLRGFCFHPGKLTCFACKTTNKRDQSLLFASYGTLLATTYPVMAFCYYRVFSKVHDHFGHVGDSSLHGNNVKSFTEEVKVTKMLFVVLVAFLIGWTPAFFIEFYDIYQGDYMLKRPVYLIMFYTLAANCAVNPLIYGWMQRHFREAYKKVLTCDS